MFTHQHNQKSNTSKEHFSHISRDCANNPNLREYSGIDVAIDSAKFHKYFNTCDTQEIRRKVECVLSKEFGEERFKWDYSYDEYGDSVGACAHHISLTRTY